MGIGQGPNCRCQLGKGGAVGTWRQLLACLSFSLCLARAHVGPTFQINRLMQLLFFYFFIESQANAVVAWTSIGQHTTIFSYQFGHEFCFFLKNSLLQKKKKVLTKM